MNEEPKRTGAQIVRLFLSGVLFIAALILIVWQTRGNREEIAGAIFQMGVVPVVASLLVTLLSLTAQAAYHVLLCQRFSRLPLDKRMVFTAFLESQVVRYLPGKIWGIVYQIHRLSGGSTASYAVLANVFQGLTSGAMTAGLSVCVLGGLFLSPAFLLGLPILVLGIELVHRFPKAELLAVRAASCIPLFSNLKTEGLRPLPWTGTFLLCAEWLTYILSFLILLSAVADPLQAVATAVWYAAASLLAMIAVFVPAGLGVREAMFLALPESSGLSVVILAATAVLLRLIQLSGELIMVGLALLIVRRTRHE